MDIEFDPAKAASNLSKHKVSFSHAEQALRDPMAVTIEDPDAEGEQRFVTLGMDSLGRVLWLSTLREAHARASSQLARPAGAKQGNTMRKEYDFSKGRRGAVIPSPGKTRITIMLDDEVLEHFRAQAEAQGSGYQTLINAALRSAVLRAKGQDSEPLTVATLREVLRQELQAV